MRAPRSMRQQEKLGRVRLSANFYMRDFLYSETADFYALSNVPDDPDLAISAGRRLCETLLEPLQATFGRLAIRSAYRSARVTAFANRRRHGASVRNNAAYHVWDLRDAEGSMGAGETRFDQIEGDAVGRSPPAVLQFRRSLLIASPR